jgi:hypothetical protein
MTLSQKILKLLSVFCKLQIVKSSKTMKMKIFIELGNLEGYARPCARPMYFVPTEDFL